MLKLSKTTDCSYIKIESDILSDFISTFNNQQLRPIDSVYAVNSDKTLVDQTTTATPIFNTPIRPGISSYTSFTITGKVNCCNDLEYSQTINEEQIGTSEWNIKFPTNTSSYINGIWFENIYSGFSFNILDSQLLVGNYSCSIGTITGLFPIVAQFFIDNFGVIIQQDYTYDPVTGECVYIIYNLPDSIKPKYFEIETSSVTTYTYFSFLPLTNAFFDGSSLLLNPEFFNQGNAFQDGVYTITLTYIDINGNIITETNCFFLDCSTACLVSTKIKELEEASNEKNATNIFLLHYTLTEGSNCGCNCEELCEIFRKLCTNLNSTSCLCGCV
jgi:hypothetical protein